MPALSDVRAKVDAIRAKPTRWLEALHLAAKIAPYIRDDEHAGAPLKILVDGHAFYLALPKNRKRMKERIIHLESGATTTHRDAINKMALAIGAEIHVVKERRRATHALCECGKVFEMPPPPRQVAPKVCPVCDASRRACPGWLGPCPTRSVASGTHEFKANVVRARNGEPWRCRPCASRRSASRWSEDARLKVRAAAKKSACKRNRQMTSEERSQRAKRAWSLLSHDRQQAICERLNPPSGRAERARRAALAGAKKSTACERSDRARVAAAKRIAKTSKAERSAQCKKGWETRRRRVGTRQ